MEEKIEVDSSPGIGGGTGKLAGVGVLFGRSWDIYRKRFQTFSLIYLLYLAPVMLISALCYSVWKTFPHPLNPFVIAWIAAGALMAVLVSVWGQAAFIYAISEPGLAAKALFQKAAHSLRKFAWLYLAFMILTVAGLVFFMVPGLVLMVWFSFSFFILASKGEAAIDCLLESREYVRGLWWPVFLRLFAVWAPAYAIGYLPQAGPLLSLLFMPFLMAYTYNLYEELAALKGAVRKPTEREKKTWGIAILAGAVIAALAIAYMAQYVDFRSIWLEEPAQKTSLPPAPAPLPKMKMKSAPANPLPLPPDSLKSA